MSEDAEYVSLVGQKNDAEYRASLCESRIENYKYKIRRLERARDSVRGLKDSFRDIQKQIKKLPDNGKQWKGATHTEFEKKIGDVTEQGDNYYRYSLDRVHDELNNEITRLQNECARQYGILGEIYSTINSLATKIANFFN